MNFGYFIRKKTSFPAVKNAWKNYHSNYRMPLKANSKKKV
jgi:hypothetical protein